MHIPERIDLIQTLFRRIHEHPFPSEDPLQDAGNFPLEYTSVIYEARSAQLAAEDLQTGNIERWKTFFDQYAELHRSQLLVGLGWALGENPELSLLEKLELNSSDRWRIGDGYGYQAGLFRRRETVRQQAVPSVLPFHATDAFDQGLGRSFWYLMLGDAERIQGLILHFPEERQASLWRGVGLAMTYVGGLTNDILEKTCRSAGAHLASLKCGALLALDGRKKAGLENLESALINDWIKLEKPVDFTSFGDFSEGLRQLETQLASTR